MPLVPKGTPLKEIGNGCEIVDGICGCAEIEGCKSDVTIGWSRSGEYDDDRDLLPGWCRLRLTELSWNLV